MALRLRAGADDPGDLDAAARARQAAARFVGRFREAFGSTRCYDLQESLVGWHSDDPSLLEKWGAAEGSPACAGICAEAARITADLLASMEPGSAP